MGKVWTANLFFTSCAGICPMITANLRSATAAFESNLSFAQLSLSVDPETDSVDKLAEYADRFDLDQQNWLLARVNREQLKDIALKKLRIGYDQSEPSLHSPHTVLIDQRLRIRGYYDATDLDAMKKLTKDIKILLQDNHPSHD